MLLNAAAIIRRRKLEFDAWLVYEAGKTWPEAEADVSEAIDFCEYYAREMQRLAGPQPVVQLPGERDEMIYLPLGVGVVIPPWNFPLAILVGMTVAALVAGNTVVIKPSSETPTIAAKFAEVLLEAGFPATDRSRLLTGSGAAVGDVLVEHPKTRFISFTGSRDVGLRINELAAKTQPGQIWIKRVIAEMGGKDAIVVDARCDLDKAVEGVAGVGVRLLRGRSARPARAPSWTPRSTTQFLEKLQARVRSIKVGHADDPANYMGPVISDSARANHSANTSRSGKKEGRLVAGGRDGARRRLFRSAHRDRGRRFQGAHFPGGDFRTGAGGDQGARFRSRPGTGQRFRIRADRRGLSPTIPEHLREARRAVLRRQSVYQPQMHRRHGGRASVRRIQHVGHGFESRRAGLPAAVPAGEVDRRARGVVWAGTLSAAAS